MEVRSIAPRSDVTTPVFLAAQLPVLQGHAAGALDRGRTVVGEKDTCQGVPGEEADQLFREPNRGFIGKAERRAMGDAVELIPDRRVDQRMPVAVDVGPDRTVAVEVFVAFEIRQDRSAARRDDERIDLGRAPVLHLREGMPEVRLVELAERLNRTGCRA